VIRADEALESRSCKHQELRELQTQLSRDPTRLLSLDHQAKKRTTLIHGQVVEDSASLACVPRIKAEGFGEGGPGAVIGIIGWVFIQDMFHSLVHTRQEPLLERGRALVSTSLACAQGEAAQMYATRVEKLVALAQVLDDRRPETERISRRDACQHLLWAGPQEQGSDSIRSGERVSPLHVPRRTRFDGLLYLHGSCGKRQAAKTLTPPS